MNIYYLILSSKLAYSPYCITIIICIKKIISWSSLWLLLLTKWEKVPLWDFGTKAEKIQLLEGGADARALKMQIRTWSLLIELTTFLKWLIERNLNYEWKILTFTVPHTVIEYISFRLGRHLSDAVPVFPRWSKQARLDQRGSFI